MADYTAFARSNYFRVKDRHRFDEWCRSLDLEVIEDDDKDRVGFLCNTYHGSLPTMKIDETTHEEDESYDFLAELAAHLKDGEVAVVIEVGYEKMRYLVGYAVAVNSENKQCEITLSDIYDHAACLGKSVTRAEY